jgi:hypothetical protein
MPRGSAPGERRGGRKKGTRNKRTVAMLEALGQVVAGSSAPGAGAPQAADQGEPAPSKGDFHLVLAPDVTPLNFFLTLMKMDDAPLELRFDAAKAAAPYVHPKLTSIDHKGDINASGIIQVVVSPSDVEL